MAVVELLKLGKRYRRSWVFKHLEFSWDGGMLLLTGPNGAGKSTLLRILAGLSRPTRGAVRVFGGDPWKDEAVRRRIGYAGHETGLYPSLTGRENLEIFRRLRGGDPDTLNMLAEMLDVRGFWNRPVREYSAGMKKKVALIRAMLHKPQILLLDEPFAALDRESREVVWGFLEEQAGHGTHVIVVSHITERVPAGARHVRLAGGHLAWMD